MRSDFPEHVRLLKAQLLASVNDAVARFKQETSVTPSRIHVRMANETHHGSGPNEYRAEAVVLEFDL